MQTEHPEYLQELIEAQIQKIERITCGGGGARGAAYSGSFRALVHTGLFSEVQDVSGTSAGAIAAALMACGANPEEFRENLLNTFFPDLLGEFVGQLFRKNPEGISFVTKDGQPLEDLIRKIIIQILRRVLDEIPLLDYPKENDFQEVLQKIKSDEPIITFGDLNILHQYFPSIFKKLLLPGVERKTGNIHIFNYINTPEVEIARACRASASIPVLLQPVSIEIQGKLIEFVDGAYYDDLPTDYFDVDEEGELSNNHPNKTLVFAFSEGLNNEKNKIFQALYGRTSFDSDWIDYLKNNVILNFFADLKSSYKHTDQKEIGLKKLREKYPLRTVELRIGDIEPTDFHKVNTFSRVVDALGYLDTVNYICNHELQNPEAFDAEAFYSNFVTTFKYIYKATLKGSGRNHKNNSLYQQLDCLDSEIAICQFIKEKVEQNLDSLEAFALSRTVELLNKNINAEQLLKETYEVSFKHSPFFSISKISGHTIFRSETLHRSLEKHSMFFLHQKQDQAKTRTNSIFKTLQHIEQFNTEHENWLQNK